MRRVRVGLHVGVDAIDDRVYAATLPDGPIIVLEHTAAVIWDELSDGDLATLPARVASRTGSDPAAIQDDLVAFVDELLRAGLLAEASDASPDEPRDCDT